MPTQAADVAARGGIDEQAPDVDSDVAHEVRLQTDDSESEDDDA